MKIYYESFLDDINYESIDQSWRIDNIVDFSNEIKELFPYQVNALKNVLKLLNLYYSNKESKELLMDKCIALGLDRNNYNINEFERKKKNELFEILSQYYDVKTKEDKKFIDAYNLFNRACFWMATASGKTIVLIKLIDILDTLKRAKLIPNNEFMVLFPDASIESQFKNAVRKYNNGKNRQIRIHSLKDFDEVKNAFTLLDEINVFSYRSDLLSDEEKAKKININAYDNYGKWFVFLDEAHKGDKSGDSKRQNYITQWTRNGFLFNFSATFTDSIDYVTTVYNYNLEKFIDDGYGKNIFVSNSYFTFSHKKDELNDLAKQKQVLKSLITSTLIKKFKKEGYYHNPLIVTLVDTVNEEDSDLYMFFKEIEKIATGDVDNLSFESAKKELSNEMYAGSPFSIGKEKLQKNYKSYIDSITIKDVLFYVFNSNTHGKIDIKMGESSKEIALQLQTSESPFLLIKIGDANKFRRDKLSNGYVIGKNYSKINYFNSLNNPDSKINILLGSRAFYEGWDSNRPNVMNFINIGSGDAKKFVLQSIGRGVRIQPEANNINKRKRAANNESFKNELFEILFIYATNKLAVKSILDTLAEQKNDEELFIEPLKKNQTVFDLVIPDYKINEKQRAKAKFFISEDCLEEIKKYFNAYDKTLFMLLFRLTNDDYEFLKQALIDKSIFHITDKHNYKDIKNTLCRLVEHVNKKERVVDKIRLINEDDIIHFKHIKAMLNEEECKKIQQLISLAQQNKTDPIKQAKKDYESGKIDLDELLKISSSIQTQEKIHYKNEVEFLNIAEHYYSPIIVSVNDKINYLKHIINVESEIIFVNNLNDFIKTKNTPKEWMFSKIDQTLDNIFIWYFNESNNKYDKFYPDFIFWIKTDNKYKIIFIDPKGFQNTDYQFKIQGYQSLFEENDKPKSFTFDIGDKHFTAEFELYMVGDVFKVPNVFKKYCITQKDFGWLKGTDN